MKTRGPGQGTVARPVIRSGFNSHRQNSRNWISSTTRWTGDSQEFSGQVVLRHDPQAQVLRESERDGELEGAYLNSHRTPDKTGEFHQIGQTDHSPPAQSIAGSFISAHDTLDQHFIHVAFIFLCSIANPR